MNSPFSVGSFRSDFERATTTRPFASNLTVGVELQLMHSPLTKQWRNPWQKFRSRRLFAEELARRTDLPIAYTGTPCESCDDAVYGATEEADEIGIAPGTVFENNLFTVKDECLERRSPVNEARGWPGVELTSPIFDNEELLHLSAVGNILDSLRAMAATTGITADESCGLHVHVGVPGGMTLLVAKKMATLALLLEKPLFGALAAPGTDQQPRAGYVHRSSGLVGDRRRDDRRGADSTSAAQLLSYFPDFGNMPSAAWNYNRPSAFSEALRRIWCSSSLQALAQLLMDGEDKLGFVLSLRDEEGRQVSSQTTRNLEGSETTFEFRYVPMTFSRAVIQVWTEMVFAVSEMALLKAAEYKERVAEMLDKMVEVAGSGDAWKPLLGDMLGLFYHVDVWEDHFRMSEQGFKCAFLDDNLLLTPITERSVHTPAITASDSGFSDARFKTASQISMERQLIAYWVNEEREAALTANELLGPQRGDSEGDSPMSMEEDRDPMPAACDVPMVDSPLDEKRCLLLDTPYPTESIMTEDSDSRISEE